MWSSSKLSAALGSLIISVFLVILRIVAYLYSGSLVVLTDLLDTSIDILAGAIATYSVYIASKPPDREHRYGHGKAEDIGGLIESMILIGAFIFILYSALDRVLFSSGEVTVTFSMPVILLISTTLAINLWRYIVLRRVAARERSKALEADSLHYLSDVLSGSTVLAVGSIGFLNLVSIDHLVLIDSMSAVAVSLYFVYSGVRVGLRAISDLMDQTPEKVAEAVENIVSSDPRCRVLRVRARRSGKTIFIDLNLGISQHLDLKALKEIIAEIESRLKSMFPDMTVDVVYNVTPEEPESIVKKIKDIASRYRGIGNVHNIIYVPTEKGGEVRLHVEIDPRMSVGKAHEIVSDIESAIYSEVKGIRKVVIHAEPWRGRIDYNRLIQQSIERDPELKAHIRIKSISTTVVGGRVFLDIVCSVPHDMDMEQAHRIVSKLEGVLRESLGDNVAVTIHIEPRHL